MKAALKATLLVIVMAAGSPALGVNISWSGNGKSGVGPLGHRWTLTNDGPGGNSAIAMPQHLGGLTGFSSEPGDFVTGFYFHTDDANIMVIANSSYADSPVFVVQQPRDAAFWERTFLD